MNEGRGEKERVMRRVKGFSKGKFFFTYVVYSVYIYICIRIHSIREREGRRKDEAVDAVAAEMFGSEVVEFA